MSGSASAALPAQQPSGSQSWLTRRVNVLRDPVHAIVIAALLTTSFLILYPLVWLFYGAFVYGDGGFAQALVAFWQLPGLWRAFENTILVVLGTVPISFLIAIPLVWITSRTDTPLRGVVELAALLPFITPPLIGAVAWSLLAAPRTGVLNVVAKHLGVHGSITNIYSMPGLIFVMGLYMSPYVFLTVKAVMDQMDARLEDASSIAGAGLWRTMRHILLPICLPGILSAAILVFTLTIEEFAIPGILGTPSGIYTITTYIFYQAISYTPPRYEIAALLASFIMAATGLGLGLQARLLSGRQRFTTVSGKAQPPRRIKLGGWRFATLAYAMGYILLAVILPYAVLIYAAFIKTWGRAPTIGNLTFSHVTATFSPDLDAGTGFMNSIILALSGATIAILLTLIVSYVIVKRRGLAGQVLEILTAIPLMMPGPVMAVAVLWAYVRPALRPLWHAMDPARGLHYSLHSLWCAHDYRFAAASRCRTRASGGGLLAPRKPAAFATWYCRWSGPGHWPAGCSCSFRWCANCRHRSFFSFRARKLRRSASSKDGRKRTSRPSRCSP